MGRNKLFKYIGRVFLIVGLAGIIIIAYFIFGGPVKPGEDTATIAIIATTLCAVLGQGIIQNAQNPSPQEPTITEIFRQDKRKD
jgi:low affinity Fe/Cu permease